MTIVQLSDGLGNQMFQYALGRCLSHRRGDELVLFTGRYLRQPAKRRYELGAFNVKGRVTDNLSCLTNEPAVWKVRELDIAFNPEILKASCRNVMTLGCWQSERYFEDVAPLIRHDFSFTTSLPDEYAPLARDIARTESVCVHVRRGDYLIPEDKKGFIGTAYYDDAIKIIIFSVGQPTFYIFSDDMHWCREHLRLTSPHYFVDTDDRQIDRTIVDFHLMTRCKHFIIANSTFSWWAAWIGGAEDKCVVAPKRWYRHDPAAVWDPIASQLQRSVDVIPAHWLRV